MRRTYKGLVTRLRSHSCSVVRWKPRFSISQYSTLSVFLFRVPALFSVDPHSVIHWFLTTCSLSLTPIPWPIWARQDIDILPQFHLLRNLVTTSRHAYGSHHLFAAPLVSLVCYVSTFISLFLQDGSVFGNRISSWFLFLGFDQVSLFPPWIEAILGAQNYWF